MPKKRKDVTLDAETSEQDNMGLSDITPSEPKTDAPKQERLSIPITSDGRIDFETMKTGNRARIESWVQSEGFRSQMGNLTGQPLSQSMSVELKNVSVIYDALAMVISTVGGSVFKWPRELTQFIHYTDEQKANLEEPTKELIKRYSPAFLVKHQELVAWSLVFSVATKEMIESAARQFILLRQSQQPAPQPNGHAESKTRVEVSQ